MPASPPASVNRAVFLSYASQDRDAARLICEALRSGGVEVWFDEGGLEHGDEWDAKIRRQIKDCMFFIPLISATTQSRLEGYFRIEWDLAAERAQGFAQGVPFLLPVTIDDTRESEALVPDRFLKVQWMHLPNGIMPPEVRARLLKLWSHRTGVLTQEAARLPAPGFPVKPASLPAERRRAAVAPAGALGGRPAPVPVPPVAHSRDGLGAPRSSSRFDNLEIGAGTAAAAKREIVKDEGYYVAEADDLYHKGRYDLALRAYSKVLEYNAATPDPWTAQVRMLIELGEFREARLWADKALERFPNQPELLAAKAVVHARMADLDSALAFSDAAIEERGNTPYVWLARGDVLLARGEARASYCFDQAMTLGRGDWVRCWEASRIHQFNGSFAAALHHAQQAVELAPGEAVAWFQAGQCHLALGNGVRASETLAQARLLDRECPGLEQAEKEAIQISSGGSLFRRIRRLFA